MGARLRSWWQKTRRPIDIIGLIVALVVAGALIFIVVRVYGTGFKGKTLWDWLQLLIIPAVLAIGGYLFTYTTGKTEREIASDRQCEEALQSYLDRMTELLLEKDLRNSTKTDEVRSVARIRTLSILHQLDGYRKRNILQFLVEADLLHAISLRNADLTHANLRYAAMKGANLYNALLNDADLYKAKLNGIDIRKSFLIRANLQEADLSGSNLSGADLRNANLRGVNLRGTNLRGADLRKANLRDVDLSETYLYEVDLRGATVTDEQLKKAKALDGATMPDGSIHP